MLHEPHEGEAVLGPAKAAATAAEPLLLLLCAGLGAALRLAMCCAWERRPSRLSPSLWPSQQSP
jgi:hypothetical protein